MLHLITPLYRFNNIGKIYESIKDYSDVTLHLAKASSKNTPDVPNDSRVVVHNTSCADNDPVCKRNHALKEVKDGYFHLLDDDTILHPGMYNLYKQMTHLGFEGMVIGKQIEKDGKVRLREETRPMYCKVDAGNVLCHYSAIHHILTNPKRQDPRIAPDYLLWELAYDHFKECKMTEDVISVYNSLK